MPNISYNLLTVKGKPNDLKTFYKAFQGHYPYYWISEQQFRPYPLKPNPYFMDTPALKGETCKQYNLRMESELAKLPTVQCYNALYPVPDYVRKTGYIITSPTASKEDKEKCLNGGAWQTGNWGTKWEMLELVVHEESETAGKYEFQSAWGYPDGWLMEVSGKFPNLRFIIDYENEGGVIGESHFKNGKIVLDFNGANPNDLRYYIIYAHIAASCKDGKFRGMTIDEYVMDINGYRSELNWLYETYNKIKDISPDAITKIPFSDKLMTRYLDDVRKAFGHAAINAFEDAKKEIQEIEKNIDSIRLDLRGSHLKLVIKVA